MPTDRHGLRLRRIRVQGRPRAIHEQKRTDTRQVAGRTKCDRAVDTLGGAIGPGSLGPIERHLFPIHGEKVLPKKLADILEVIAKATDDRVVAPNRVLGLRHVDDVQAHNREYGETDRKYEQVGEETQNLVDQFHYC